MDTSAPAAPSTHEWLTTAPHPWKKAHREGHDQNQVGWRAHCIVGATDGRQAALCGLCPAHGWACDLFIEEPCARCYNAAKARGLSVPSEMEWARQNTLQNAAAMERADP